MIMHPYRPDMDGTDLSDFKDPTGKKLFVEFVKTVKSSPKKRKTHQASKNIVPDNFINPKKLSKIEKLLLKNATAGIVEISNKLKYLVKFLLA